MRAFLKKHRAVHIWTVLVAALFGLYAWGISSREAANTVSAVTQSLKDGYARLWYRFPFSVVEWFYVAFILAVILWVVLLAVRVVKGPDRGRRLYGGLLGLVCLCLTAWGLYCVLWGVNYYADGFQEKSGIYAQPVELDDLERVTRYFAENLRDLADEIPRDDNGIFAVPQDEIFAESTTIYDNISREFPFLARQDRVPKKMFFSRLFSAMNFTGFYSPYTGESNLNVDSPACLLPADITHELAHQRGIASEQECNFLAVVASTTCGDPVYAYSGWLMGYIHLSNALYDADREAWQVIRDRLPESVVADLTANNAYWAQYKGAAAAAGQTVYDTVLKAYGDAVGIRSYGTVVDLLTVYYRDAALES